MKKSIDLIYNVTELQQEELVNISGGDAADVGYAIGYGIGFTVGFVVFGVGAFIIIGAEKLLK